MRLLRQLAQLLRVRFSRTYSDSMPGEITPVPYPPELQGLEGKWVAVKDGRVVAAETTSRNLVAKMKHEHIVGATVQYVPMPEEGYKVGLG